MNQNHLIESWIAELALAGRLARRQALTPVPSGS
jgi:hypothetical protein